MKTKNISNNEKQNQVTDSLDVNLLNSASSIVEQPQQRKIRRMIRRHREGPPTTIIDGILVEEE